MVLNNVFEKNWFEMRIKKKKIFCFCIIGFVLFLFTFEVCCHTLHLAPLAHHHRLGSIYTASTSRRITSHCWFNSLSPVSLSIAIVASASTIRACTAAIRGSSSIVAASFIAAARGIRSASSLHTMINACAPRSSSCSSSSCFL